MSGVEIAAFAVLGLFAGAAIWMIGRAQAAGQRLLARPACAACAAPWPLLGWLPAFGWSAARRCANCGAGRPAHRLLFEVAVALYFALAAARLGFTQELAATLVFAVPLLVILLVDWWTRFIYTQTVGVGLLAALAFAALNGWDSLASAAGAALGAAVVFALFYALAAAMFRNVGAVPFGAGDIYLAAMIGAMARYPLVITALFAGIFLAGLGSILLLATGRVGRRDVIPYGPYLCAGALLVLLTRG